MDKHEGAYMKLKDIAGGTLCLLMVTAVILSIMWKWLYADLPCCGQDTVCESTYYEADMNGEE